MSEDKRARLDLVISSLVSDAHRLPPLETVRWLCDSIQPLFLSEASLLVLDSPIRVCGDLHGQFVDLLRIFELGGLPPGSRYLFLGDYVDRGKKSLEVIVLLFALKLRYPKSVFLIRGNHETPEMTELFGFADECREKYDRQLWPLFLRVFDTLPIGAVVANRYFCIHGGLSPELTALDDVRAIHRPAQIPDDGLVADLLWSDPSSDCDEWGPNERGATITWGLKSARRFLDRTGLRGIIRAHQMADSGYDYPFEPDRCVMTVFTASKYAGEFHNKAAFVTIGEDLEAVVSVLRSSRPHIRIEAAQQPKRPATARRTATSLRGERAKKQVGRRHAVSPG
jgi:serine/threonine-protein phosphatase PP1 catalytic subunit